MLKEREAAIRQVIIFIDSIIVAFAFLIAFYIRQHFHSFFKFDLFRSVSYIAEPPSSFSEYIIVFFLVVPIWSIMLYFSGMYSSLRTRTLIQIFWILVKASFLAIVGFGTVIFILDIEIISRLFFTLFVLISFFLILTEKVILLAVLHQIRKRGLNNKRLLVVGTGKRAAQFIEELKKHPESGLQIIGAIDDEPGRGVKKVHDASIIGELNNITEILHKYAIDEVIFIVPRSRLNFIEKAVYACEIEGIKSTIAVDLFDVSIARARPTEIYGIPLITFDTTVAKEWELLIKRVSDISISGIGLILLSPLFLISAILIKSTSEGPVMFKQERVTLNGRKFMLCKFRTMYKGAEKERFELEDLNEMDGPVFKIKKDPRITKIGKILRKFSIDELPQLYNVFIGHMSLVGPRPLPVYEVEEFESWQRRRLSMRPGITCLWQVNGRSKKIDFEEWVRMDLDYLDNWSLWLDFKILIKTIPAVLFGRGAY